MALSISLLGVSANCQAVSTTVTGSTANYALRVYLLEGEVETLVYQEADIDETSYPVTTVNIADLTNSTFNELYDTDPDLDLIIESITSFDGLFKVTIDDGDTTEIVYSIGTCSIDCCLANLIQNNLDCNCSGDDCCEDIKKAEKILILTRAAILDAANADIAGATEKYNKAVELCGATPCDCNC